MGRRLLFLIFLTLVALAFLSGNFQNRKFKEKQKL